MTKPLRLPSLGDAQIVAGSAADNFSAQNFLGFSIIAAMDHPEIWQRWFADRQTWRVWRIFLKAIFGLGLAPDELAVFRKHTGRKRAPREAADEVWLVCGRKAGKSFILALCACYLACFRDWRRQLSPGERGTIMVVAADKRQARIIFNYCRALITEVPVLAALVERDNAGVLDLKNQVTIEVHAASVRGPRGYTLVGGAIDELAFLDTAETAANQDEEILGAIRPAMTSIVGSMLFCASSPFGKFGALWRARQRFWGVESGPFLWHAASPDMNPTLAQKAIDRQMALDPDKTRREIYAEFSDSAGALLTQELVEAAVDDIPVRPAREGVPYYCFVDGASGVAGGDAFAACVAHSEGKQVFVDLFFERAPPFDPHLVLVELQSIVEPYGLAGGLWYGDHYSANWIVASAAAIGAQYLHSQRDQTRNFLEMLPLFASARIRMPRNDRAQRQLLALRRSMSGGRERVEHPRGIGLHHGDLAAALAGAAVLASQKPEEIVTVPLADLSTAAPVLGPEPWRGFNTLTGERLSPGNSQVFRPDGWSVRW